MWFKNIYDKFCNTKTARFVTDVAFILWCVACLYSQSSFLHKLISFVAGFVVYKIIYSFLRATDEVNMELPNFGKRFTKKGIDGAVIVDTERLHEAILYLYSLEEYIEKSR